MKSLLLLVLLSSFVGCNNQISGTLELFEDVKLKKKLWRKKTIPAGVHLASIEIKSNKKFSVNTYGQTFNFKYPKNYQFSSDAFLSGSTSRQSVDLKVSKKLELLNSTEEYERTPCQISRSLGECSYRYLPAKEYCRDINGTEVCRPVPPRRVWACDEDQNVQGTITKTFSVNDYAEKIAATIYEKGTNLVVGKFLSNTIKRSTTRELISTSACE